MSKASKICIVLPEYIESGFVVPVQTLPDELKLFVIEAIKEFIPEPLQVQAIEYLESSRNNLIAPLYSEMAQLPLGALDSTGSTEEDISKLTNAVYWIIFQGSCVPVWPPTDYLLGRTICAALAAKLDTWFLDGPRLELLSSDVVLKDLRTEETHLRFSDWLRVTCSVDEYGSIWMTTKGMYLVGLPEIQAFKLPKQFINQMGSVMTGLAWKLVKLLQEHRQSSPDLVNFDIPLNVRVAGSDIEEAYQKNTPAGSTIVHLRFDEQLEEHDTAFLTIVPPAFLKLSDGEYYYQVCSQIYKPVEKGAVVKEWSSAMTNAVNTARAGLNELRSRYLEGEVPSEFDLIVKYRVTNGVDTEYLWAYVTGWPQAELLNVNYGNDSRYDPDIRVGKPATLPSESIVDWVLMCDAEIILGGWTNQVLGKDSDDDGQ